MWLMASEPISRRHLPNPHRALLASSTVLSYVSAVVLLLVVAHRAIADDRIYMDGTVNGHPVTFYFDTGSSHTTIWRRSAEKLQISVTNLPEEDLANYPPLMWGTTKNCNINFDGISAIESLWVGDLIEEPEVVKDGLLGWNDISKKSFQIVNQKLLLASNPPPVDDASWIRFNIETDRSILVLSVPDSSGLGLEVAIDTGDFRGIELSSRVWRKWREAHPRAPATVLTSYAAAERKTIVREQAWAPVLSLGSLQLTNVVITKGSVLSRFDAVLGMGALEHLELFVDTAHGTAYVRQRNGQVFAVEHNHLGALFMPRDGEHGELLAHVAESSPAQEAGILPNDVLLAVDNLNVASDHPDGKLLHDLWQRPPGTQMTLTIRRGEKIVKAHVTLRQIIPPEPPSDVEKVEKSH